MSYIALIHAGRIQETTFAPMRDWVPCGHDWDWERILAAYTIKYPEQARQARGAVIIMYDQFCVLGYHVLPVPEAAELPKHWRALARTVRIQVGVKLKPDPLPKKSKSRRKKTSPGRKNVDTIVRAVERFKREQNR